MTTNVDIVNRSLQLIGTRTTITAMNEQSNEAVQANLVYTAVQNWCLVQANWNFARKMVTLTQQRAVVPPVGIWTESESPPPWLYVYSLPAGFLRAIYLTNNDHAASDAYWLGEPQRFVIASASVGDPSAEQTVLLTNVDTPAILVYTASMADPTLWPAFFERFMVAVLAWTLAPSLTEDKSLVKELEGVWVKLFISADQINREEGLTFGDTTPEWIQALGINYPYRRDDGRLPKQISQRRQNNDDAG